MLICDDYSSFLYFSLDISSITSIFLGSDTSFSVTLDGSKSFPDTPANNNNKNKSKNIIIRPAHMQKLLLIL